ncbi:unnamed protein product, partial [marine sediment metagenome]
ATVVEVRRTRVGPYHVEQAKGLEELLGYKLPPTVNSFDRGGI